MDTEEAVLTLTPTEALRMLAHLYVEKWPENKDHAMAAYYAGQRWVNILAESDHELAETAKNSCFWDMIPLVCDDISKETLERYELQPFDRDRFLEVLPFVSDDPVTKQVLEIGTPKPYNDKQESEREKTLHFTDETTVGEFCHFFDFLFDGTRACRANLQKGKAEGANLQKGKAEIRIIRNKRRLLDDMPIKDILNPDRTDELVLSDTMTVAEAEKKLSSCFVEGCFVDIYPRNGGYKINKDMLLKDIRHLQAKLHDTSFYF